MVLKETNSRSNQNLGVTGSELRKTGENPPEEGENLAFHTERLCAYHTFLPWDKWASKIFCGVAYSGSSQQFKTQVVKR